MADVWTLDGRTMRRAAVDARTEDRWDPTPTPLLGLLSDIEGSPQIRRLRDADLVTVETFSRSGDDVGLAGEVRNSVLQNLTRTYEQADREPPRADPGPLPRDPLARAQALLGPTQHEPRLDGC